MLAYLHGFASGPGSTKARFFGARLAAEGKTLAVPDLAPDFTHFTITSMVEIVERLVGDGPAVLLGSSLGGWVATLIAARRPERIRALVLFAPAFGFAERWQARIGAEALARWRREGSMPVFHYGHGREVPLAVGLLDDAGRHDPEPDPRCPALVFAGRRDDAVPLACVEQFTAGRPERELVVFDTGHDLNDVLEPMWERMRAFLGAVGA
jgi:pimeloyl-ACP methyl ester carboxylesterase